MKYVRNTLSLGVVGFFGIAVVSKPNVDQQIWESTNPVKIAGFGAQILGANSAATAIFSTLPNIARPAVVYQLIVDPTHKTPSGFQ